MIPEVPAGMSFSGRLANWFSHRLWAGLDWLFPPYCAGCQAPGMRWCVDCQRQVKPLGDAICPICGAQQDTPDLCPRCSARPPRYTRLRSWTLYEGVIRQAIHRLKYQRDVALGEVLAQYLIRCFERQDWNVDLVIPVPLALDRYAERGYNQASLLAKPFAWRVGLPYAAGALRRVRETRSQVGLNAQERRYNVFGAFSANAEFVKDKRVLVVDDVATTGSTLDACAWALLEAGAIQVYCLTLAQALHRTDHLPMEEVV